MKNTILLLTSILLFTLTGNSQPVELGKVSWLRDYDAAVAQASKTDKDILILFQEVPGCATCRNYGNNVLSDPLLVEAIETYFVPLAVFNNHKGADAQTLKKFKEPSWNNPVVRIVDTAGKDVVDRLAGQYSSAALIRSMQQALDARSEPIPKYMQLLSDEQAPTDELVLGMYCFWSGEKVIGNLRGVIATEAGHMSGHEVVKVTYDPSITSQDNIINTAKKQSCADLAFTDDKDTDISIKTKKLGSYRKDKEDKYYLLHSKYKNLNLSNAQATKVNSYLGQGLDPEEWLSPRQIANL